MRDISIFQTHRQTSCDLKKIVFFLILTTTYFNAQALRKSDRIIDSDVDNFWKAFDLLISDTTKNPFVEYLNYGTIGLADFVPGRIESAERLKRHVLNRIDFYRHIRESIYTYKNYTDKIDQIYEKFHAIFPDAVLPMVYFVIGRENSGGTATRNGLSIALENFSYSETEKSPHGLNSSMHNIVDVIAHELVHYHQKTNNEGNLLYQCLKEGSADFIAEILVSGLNLDSPLWKERNAYGKKNECTLWNEFIKSKDDTTYGPWLYADTEHKPADMGYWIGYKVCETFFKENRADKNVYNSLLEISTLKNFMEIKMLYSFCK
jgi:hypothetical protein